MNMQLIDPQKFEVVKVYSFFEPYTGKSAYVGYYRPYSKNYNHAFNDDFDTTFVEWLKNMNLQNVQRVASEDIMFDIQKPRIQQIYDGGRPSTMLALTCHGNYTMDEIMQLRQINGCTIDIPVHWNSVTSDFLIPLGGVMTFDKTKESYFLEVLNTIVPL